MSKDQIDRPNTHIRIQAGTEVLGQATPRRRENRGAAGGAPGQRGWGYPPPLPPARPRPRPPASPPPPLRLSLVALPPFHSPTFRSHFSAPSFPSPSPSFPSPTTLRSEVAVYVHWHPPLPTHRLRDPRDVTAPPTGSAALIRAKTVAGRDAGAVRLPLARLWATNRFPGQGKGCGFPLSS